MERFKQILLKILFPGLAVVVISVPVAAHCLHIYLHLDMNTAPLHTYLTHFLHIHLRFFAHRQ